MKYLSRRKFVKGIVAGSLLSIDRFTLNAKTLNKKNLVLSKINDKVEVLKGKEFHLSIDYSLVNFTQTISIATTVNNSLPAPTLIWEEGQEVILHVTNNLKETSSIHWHGIILPFEMDGVPGITFDGIKPGETFTYKFKVNQSGTYWYHSHSGFQEQTGVYGAIVIKPKIKEPYDYDSDYVITLSDWSDEDPNNIYRNLKLMSDYYSLNQRTVFDFAKEVKKIGFLEAFRNRKMWNEMNMSDRDLSDVTGYTYTYLMNGQNPNSSWKLLFKNGERIRLRFINASAMTFFDVRIPGLEMKVIAADGNYIQAVNIDEFRIGVAETYDVIVEPKKDMAYSIFAQSIDRSGYALGLLTSNKDLRAEIPKMDEVPSLNHMDMGMNMNHSQMNMPMNNKEMNMPQNKEMKMDRMNPSSMKMPMQKDTSMDMKEMKYSEIAMHKMNPKQQNIPITELPFNEGVQNAMKVENPQYRLNDPGVGLRNNGRRVLTYADLKNKYSTKHESSPNREIILHLTGNMERYMWSMNGIKFTDSFPLEFEYGERIRITLINDTMMNHPMHLHGLWSDLETGDDNYLVRKHTVIVQPGSKISYRVSVDAKGAWAYHCHLIYHMPGMFRKVLVK